jgi:hypothetical protein
MFLEALLTRDEIHARLEEAFPFLIRIGDPSAGHTLTFTDLGEVKLVEDVGLHIACKARVHWPVLGIDVPVVLRSLRLVVIPRMKSGPLCDVLAFHVAIEHAGVPVVPDAIEHEVIVAINRRLADEHVEAEWAFATLFDHVLPLPRMIEPLDAALLRATWGRLRVTGEAIVIAVSVHAAILRTHGTAPPEFAPLLAAGSPRLTAPSVSAPAKPRLTTRLAGELLAGGLVGLAAGAAFFALGRAIGRVVSRAPS